MCEEQLQRREDATGTFWSGKMFGKQRVAGGADRMNACTGWEGMHLGAGEAGYLQGPLHELRIGTCVLDGLLRIGILGLGRCRPGCKAPRA